MRLVYKFNIGQNEEISKLCKISNNLYNQALYIFREMLSKEGKWLSYFELDSIMKNTKNLDGDINYKLLKAQCSQPCGVGAPHKRYRVWFIASDCSDARVEGLRQGREDKIHGFEFTSQTRDKIRRLITDTSGLRSHRFLYDKEDDKKQRSTENRFFKKYACRDWDGRGSTQWKSFPTQSPICRGNDGLPFNVDNLTIPYGKWRKESIKAYGNAIVPLIAVKIFEMINKIERYEQQTTL